MTNKFLEYREAQRDILDSNPGKEMSAQRVAKKNYCTVQCSMFLSCFIICVTTQS